ncbi:MAG: efflux RND transporter periplasmic adaptor subunit [Pseudomonadota bacterium]|jgi:multidrug efflux system membrane fusion protein|uniref:efflux RND transporter periplasmic adaptor subunit n=1 Tax=Aquabacterium sp. TaxID=1872578 RepID=UPI003BB12C09
MFNTLEIWRLVQVTCLAATMMHLSGCNSDAAANSNQGPPPPEVDVASVVTRAVNAPDEFNGRVSAVDTVSLRPRVSGYIERVAYKEGDEVSKGDLLFVIDQRPYKDALNTVLAQLERAKTASRLAKAQVDRVQTLIAANAVSREEFDSRQADLEQTLSDVRAAEAAVASAKLNLAFTEIRAPISGRAGRAMLSVGNLAQSDQSLLSTVVSQDPMYVYFNCDERSYQRFQEIAKRNGRTATSGAVRIGLASDTGFPYEGKVNFLDNHVDPETGTIRARAILPNPDRRLTPGMFARVQFDANGEFKAMLVNERAILTDQDRKYLYVVGPENKAMRKDVMLGPLIREAKADAPSLRVIESGLDANDKVIVGGTQKIFYPGMVVKPVNAPAETVAEAGTKPPM